MLRNQLRASAWIRPIAVAQRRAPIFSIADGEKAISSPATMQRVVAVGMAYLRFAMLRTGAGRWGISGSGIHLFDVVDPWRWMHGLALEKWQCFCRLFLVG